MPVKTETFEELSGPLVHTNFPTKTYGPMIGPYELPPKFVWTNGPESSSKVSVLTHLAAKGGRQKGIGKKVTNNEKKVTKK